MLVHAITGLLPVALVVGMEAVLAAALELAQAGWVRVGEAEDALRGIRRSVRRSQKEWEGVRRSPRESEVVFTCEGVCDGESTMATASSRTL